MAQPECISVAIADDRETVREELSSLLAEEEDFRIAGEAASGAEAVALVARMAPDILLMNGDMPKMSGAEAASRIGKMKLQTRIILFADNIEDAARVRRALDAGVMGYLPEGALKEDLPKAVRKARAGAPCYHVSARRLLKQSAASAALRGELTPRERDILKEMADGKSNRKIAQTLGLTEGTVKGYVSVILSKLGAGDRTQAVLYAVKHGLT